MKNTLQIAAEAFSHAGHPCEDHDRVQELQRGIDGYIVVLKCSDCDLILGFLHPKAALEISGADSNIGNAVLAVFPEWAYATQ